MSTADDHYLTTHVREALADDPRAAELGIDVTLVGDMVVLTGTVGTEGRRQAVADVASEVLEGRRLRNDVTVADLTEAETMEQL